MSAPNSNSGKLAFPVNMGRTDRNLRMVAAPLVVLLAVRKGRIWRVAGLGLAAAMLWAARTGHCPLYTLFGLSTCPVKEDSRP